MRLRLVLSTCSGLVLLAISGSIAAPAYDAAPLEATAAARAELGRLLFWDPILSGNRDVSCATCHHPDFAYADGRDLSLGAGAVGLGPARVDVSGGEIPVVRRNAPTLLNVTFNGFENPRRGRGRDVVVPATPTPRANGPMFWDNRVRGLEAQALEPLRMLEEMRGNAYPEEVALDSVLARLRSIPEYLALFRAAFGPTTDVAAQELALAIAEFERTLVAVNSPFDRFRLGDASAMTEQQQRGRREFNEAGCNNCHRGLMFSDFDLHAEGVPENPRLDVADAGGGRFRFRTPSLRNVALTAPYMHNGTLATLEDVLRFYDRGRSENPNVADRLPPGVSERRRGGDVRDASPNANLARLDPRFRGVRDLDQQEMEDIIAFLQALTDPDFDRMIPFRVPSGLPPGGRIE